LDGLVRPGGIDFIGSFAIQPVISAAQAGSLRADYAYVGRGKGLTEGAGVKDLGSLIGHALDAFIASRIGLLSYRQEFLDFRFIGVELHLALVKYRAEILMKFSMQDFADVLKCETLFDSLFADALAARLGMVFAVALTKQKTLLELAAQLYKDKIQEAQTIDSMEKTPSAIYSPDLLNVR
jgi:hypothetical protein